MKASGAFKAFCISLSYGFLRALAPFVIALWERSWPSGLFWVYLGEDDLLVKCSLQGKRCNLMILAVC